MSKTKLEAIRQMNNEELAFFLSIVQWNDLNCIHLMPKEDIDYFKKYLNEDGEGLIESVHYSLEDWKSYNSNTLEEQQGENGNNN